MNDELISAVLERASADENLTEDAKLLVLAALGGDDDLAQALETEQPAQPPEPAPVDRVAPVRAFLSSVTVEGFRGIGPSATLRLTPGPGLVIVSGRNGSGKSSFAEALEVALTGQSYRWQSRPATLQQRWRNLHGGTAAIRVELAEEGRGTTTVGAVWSAETALGDVRCWVQRPGEKRAPGLTTLGWTEKMGPFRPFLSYDELDALLSAGSKLHETLDSILGLRRIDDARRRLQAGLKEASAPKETADKLRRTLRPDLEGLDDDRARLAVELLAKRPPPLELLAALATGDHTDDGAASALREVAELELPPVGTYADAVARVQAAQSELAGLEVGEQAASRRRLGLLKSAITLHGEHGEGPCPVCGVGRLDESWKAQVSAELTAHDQHVARAREAADAVEHAWAALRVLRPPLPAALQRAIVEGVPGASEAAETWSMWYALNSEETLDRGADVLRSLTGQLAGVAAAARDLADRRQSVWQPVALRLAEWLTHARRAEDADARRRSLTSAHEWLRDHADLLRNDRLRPLADRAREIWSLLRQESNVDLGEITLTGQGNHRRVQLSAAVDGEEAGALEVMSQGEMNALALSIFIPKACLPDSPFGFIVIDDPVQAMDPSKVDGLARVLSQISKDRQVVVFTHDDRLAEAVRRLQIDARLVEVTRDAQSFVSVAETLDPAKRYLDDARATALDSGVEETLKRRVIAEMCRLGLESRCRDVFFGKELAGGARRRDVEDKWTSALGTGRKVALAVMGEKNAHLKPWIEQGRDRQRPMAFGVCTSAPHDGVRTSPMVAIQAVERLVDDISQMQGAGRRGR
jgi:recombinational DNA repair ATPase RecF